MNDTNLEILGYEVIRYYVCVYDKTTYTNHKFNSYPAGTEEDALAMCQKYTNLGHKCSMIKIEEAIIE